MRTSASTAMRSAVGDGTNLVRGFVPLRRATPRRLARLARIAAQRRRTVAGLAAAAAIRDGRAVALVDDVGMLTYDELDQRAATVAGELNGRGVLLAGHRLGILCRNGRGLVITLLAASRIGADVVLLSPTADGISLAAALREEDLHVVAHDEDLTETLGAAHYRGTTIIADRSAPGQLSVRDLELLPRSDAPVPDRPGRIVVRHGPPGRSGARLDVDLGRLLTPLPVRRGSPVLIMAPLAQPTGLAAWAAAVVQECPTVLTARDGATAAQQLAAEHGVGLIVPADAG